jgi:hypothetical protein
MLNSTSNDTWRKEFEIRKEVKQELVTKTKEIFNKEKR